MEEMTFDCQPMTDTACFCLIPAVHAVACHSSLCVFTGPQKMSKKKNADQKKSSCCFNIAWILFTFHLSHTSYHCCRSFSCHLMLQVHWMLPSTAWTMPFSQELPLPRGLHCFLSLHNFSEPAGPTMHEACTHLHSRLQPPSKLAFGRWPFSHHGHQTTIMQSSKGISNKVSLHENRPGQ